MRRQDRDALERSQRKQVCIPGNEVGGAAARSELEKFVVFRVAANSDARPDFHPFGLAGEGCEEPPHVFFINIFPELLSTENLVQLGQGGPRDEDLSVRERAVESVSRNGLGEEEGADQDVGIEDEAQATRPSARTPGLPASTRARGLCGSPRP